MPNSDNVVRLIGGSAITVKDFAPLALGTSTTETAFSKNSLTVGTTSVIASVAGVISVNPQGASPSPWDMALTGGRMFFVQFVGICTTNTSTNLTLKLYQVPASIVAAATALTVSNDNLIATTTARAVNSTTKNWWIGAQLMWNSTSKLLEGNFSDQIGNLLDGYAVTTDVTTATATDAELNFILSATLSSGNAANVVTITEATISVL